MKILGLDLSLSSTGINIIDENEEILLCDKICTDSKKNTEDERLYIVANAIKKIIEENKIDIVVAENQFFSKNPRTGLTLSKLMGAVIYVCQELNVQFQLLSPTQARKILCGDGKLKKEQVAEFIRENYIDLGEFIDRNCKAKNSDKYDSLVISLAWLKQNKLNELYDNFTKKYGLINSRANATAFSNDNSYYLLCSLEILDENGNLSRKADIFSKRTIKAHKQPKSINNSNDALIYSISEKAKVDLDFMSDVSKIPKEKLVKDLEGLIFKIPSEDKYVTADEYLSGNVREKLKDAEKANELEPIYNINIKYLKESLPKYLNASDINVRLGTTWIPKEYYQEFMEYLFEMDYYAKRKVKINYSDIRNEWYIDNKSYDNYNLQQCSIDYCKFFPCQSRL